MKHRKRSKRILYHEYTYVKITRGKKSMERKSFEAYVRVSNPLTSIFYICYNFQQNSKDFIEEDSYGTYVRTYTLF